MKVVAVISRKGGAGKTTLALHLAHALAQRGKAIVLDLDAQQSADKWRARRPDDAAGPDVQAVSPSGLHHALQRAWTLSYAWVLLDTPPHADGLAMSAARAADLVLIPCRPSIFDLDAISATIDIARHAGKVPHVVLNAVEVAARGALLGNVGRGIEARGGIVAASVIRNRAAYRNAPQAGQVAAEWDAGSGHRLELSALVDEFFPMEAV